MIHDDSPPPLIPPGPKLSFKQRAPEFAAPVERFHDPVQEPGKNKKRRKRKKAKSVKPGSAFLQSLAGFLLVLCILGGLLYHQIQELTLLDPHYVNLARIIIVVGFWVVLMIEAFNQDMMQGLFCVFFPPYAFVYGLLFADAGPLRGLTVGILLYLGGEIYFQPEDAQVLHAKRWVEGVVQKGQGLIMDKPRREAGFEK